MYDVTFRTETKTGNDAASYVAYQLTDNAFIYPITPSTPMATYADVAASSDKKNVFGKVGIVVEMQSEAGAAGALHGALVGGGLCSTYTCSQGLLLMIPNMYKIAGEMLPCVFHISARAIAGQALSIYGEHSDIMACRSTGFSFICSQSVQEAHDIALVSHIASLKASMPFGHFFDGFRTSHETTNIRVLTEDSLKQFVPWEAVQRHRDRAVNPNHPNLRGTAQNPDIFMQLVEGCNSKYDAIPGIVDAIFEDLKTVFGRRYRLFEYEGAPDAEDIIITMGSSTNVVQETVNYLNARGGKVGVLKVRLYRPWSVKHLFAAMPSTVKRIAVLDRCKDPAGLGEPLYLEIRASLSLDESPCKPTVVVGGRYGLGSKDFTPGHVLSIFQNLRAEKPVNSFTVGIVDDVTFRSLPLLPEPDTVPKEVTQAIMWGMGSDGTVSVSKTIMKILGDHFNMNVQAYSEYEAKKSNGYSLNYLRYGPVPFECPYNVRRADFVSCSNPSYVSRFDMLTALKPKGVFLLNTSATTLAELEALLPGKFKRQLAQKEARLFLVDATNVAQRHKLGKFVNTTMGVVYFKLMNPCPLEAAIELMKDGVKKEYSKKGDAIVQNNYACIDASVDSAIAIEYPCDEWLNAPIEKPHTIEGAPDFINKVMLPVLRLEGDSLAVSSFAPGGQMPSGTGRYEKRGISTMNPQWQIANCTQCNQCATVCPHACIRPFLLSDAENEKRPASFETLKSTGAGPVSSMHFRIQLSPMDCTGCSLCVEACGDNALVMKPMEVVRPAELANWDYAMTVTSKSDLVERNSVRNVQFYQPMLEFSGACDGCGETPYVKLMTQLFGERMSIANATGCSSIWGGTATFNPYTHNAKGQGPAWANSLFEDNAEYGLGMFLSLSQRRGVLKEVVQEILKNKTAEDLPKGLFDLLSDWIEVFGEGKRCQKFADSIMFMLKEYEAKTPKEQRPQHMADLCARKDLFSGITQWIVGGDGWAYDIGYGGVDHVLSTGENVNILVLDTEMYSNTGGQKSKATPISAVQQFANGGKRTHKKEMGLMAMQYGNVYVASIALYADMTQAIRAFNEAESYPGPSIIFAYAPCISHNIVGSMRATIKETEIAVSSGYWPLYRYDPRLKAAGKVPFQLDYAKDLSDNLNEFLENERRFMNLRTTAPDAVDMLHKEMSDYVKKRHDDMVRRAMPEASLAASAKMITHVGPELTILYGTQTNNSRDLAMAFKQEAEKRNMNVTINEMNEMSIDELKQKQLITIVCSTAGNGDFPFNAEAFWTRLNDPALPADLLKNVSYSVFGLGDSNYPLFNNAAKKIDTRFKELGAKCIVPIALGNDQDADKYMTAYEEWEPALFESIQVKEPVSVGVPSSNYTVEMKSGENVATLNRRRLLSGGAKLVPLVKKQRLTPEAYDRNIMHLEFDLTETGIHYKAGDTAVIYPTNSTASVKEMCEYLGMKEDDCISITTGAETLMSRFPRVASVGKILTEVLDFNGRPARKFYRQLAKFAQVESERSELELLASSQGAKKLEELVSKECVSFFDLLKMFPSAKVDFAHLLDLIPNIKPRYYSIASSNAMKPNRLELCIVVVDLNTASGKYKKGLCTGYLDSLEVKDVPVPVALSIHSGVMALPPQSETPIIMAGLGTGIAPFRSFIQEKKLQVENGKKIGEVVFMPGLRSRATEYLYGEEFEQLKSENVISHLLPAFSRDQERKVYIQDKVNENPQLICDILVEKKGYFYYCGPAGAVPNAIEKSIVKAFMSVYGKGEEDALGMVELLKNHGRYIIEAWS